MRSASTSKANCSSRNPRKRGDCVGDRYECRNCKRLVEVTRVGKGLWCKDCGARVGDAVSRRAFLAFLKEYSFVAPCISAVMASVGTSILVKRELASDRPGFRSIRTGDGLSVVLSESAMRQIPRTYTYVGSGGIKLGGSAVTRFVPAPQHSPSATRRAAAVEHSIQFRRARWRQLQFPKAPAKWIA